MRQYNKVLITSTIVLACAAVLIGCLFVVSLLFGNKLLSTRTLFARQASYLEIARSRVQIGDNRDQAVDALSDAWFHTECRYPNGVIIDLFFYGPQDRDKVEVISVKSEETENNDSQVVFVGQVESYMLHLYDECVPSPSEAFDGDLPTSMP